MKLKIVAYVGTILVMITCTAVIIMGYLSWHQRIENKAQASDLEYEAYSKKEEEESKLTDLKERTKTLPAAMRQKFYQAAKEKRPLEIVFVGSKATSTSPNSWPTLLEKQLKAAYGKEFIHVTIKTYSQQTSKDLLNGGIVKEVMSTKPDIVLVEPPLLNEYQAFSVDRTLSNLSQLLGQWKEKQVVVIIQPPNPLYKNDSYINEVKQLHTWATDLHYTYVNHWEAWPSSTSDDLLSYLTEDHLLPNEKGQKLWSDFLTHYFISK
ncbi:SGNH/GDSL hydrolase family protein [Priestia koreensis]|uniref:SGNH/GDSL hydrolase family protein n=1 Tax=Priestia koreensis TaxID=284581 RepID=A0A0M0LHA7_9BACI|nr:SGNH/GDSL hydrolase family protein [Priestia koreensis]KOO50440.1 hypothetical protein AMD01_01405 [Priestia koreensis]